MDIIKAITFVGAKADKFADDKSKESLCMMKEKTGCNTVIFHIGALQDTAQSELIDYKHPYIPKDEELKDMIYYAKKNNLKVILKPVINCKDGTWRAYISFFEVDVICEPKWDNWFKSYKTFITHYAAIAEETNCDMFFVGSNLVQTEVKEHLWRDVIDAVRSKYTGPITYAADKYLEQHLKWWDALDVISSCAYYPKNDFAKELNRIEEVVKKHNKPFIFSEIGCKSTKGSADMPNRWSLQGSLDLEEQAEYFNTVLSACKDREFVKGVGIWSWSYHIPELKVAREDKGYRIYAKPSCQVIKKQWT